MHNIKRHRLEQFSDGVIAIAITLLAFELKAPVLSANDLQNSFFQLLDLLPTLLTFILSFVTIAILWVNHHQMTEHIDNLSRKIIWANMVFLMFLALIPFATRAIAENPYNFVSVTTYGFIMLCTSLSFSITHLWIHKKINHNVSLSSKLIKRSLIGPILYTCATVAAFNYVPIAYFLLMIPPLYYFLPKKSQG
ncbi:MAG: potassium channel family protein [Patescibacteria group bacterium]|nr:potassium channel family protein [Patescibacteria group bacterium]